MIEFEVMYRQMLDKLADKVEDPRLPDRDLRELGNRAMDLILDRTKRGKDYQGDEFQEYSEAYADHREANGRNVDRVTLKYEGIMLGALTAVAADGTALLRFSNSDAGRIANYHNSLEPRSKIPLRRFLDVTEGTNEYKKLAGLAAKMYAKRIEG